MFLGLWQIGFLIWPLFETHVILLHYPKGCSHIMSHSEGYVVFSETWWFLQIMVKFYPFCGRKFQHEKRLFYAITRVDLVYYSAVTLQYKVETGPKWRMEFENPIFVCVCRARQLGNSKILLFSCILLWTFILIFPWIFHAVWLPRYTIGPTIVRSFLRLKVV